ncbi:GFA family protein [Pseudomonas prosekii]
MDEFHQGNCLCGAVRYEVSAPLKDVPDCQCRKCRR